MNIVEALKIAKEQGKKVRPVGRGCQVIKYKNGSFLNTIKFLMVLMCIVMYQQKIF